MRSLWAKVANLARRRVPYADPWGLAVEVDMDPTQKQLAELFAIDRYAPTR